MSRPFARTTRSLALDSSRRTLTVLVLAGIALLAWMIWFLGAEVTLYERSRSARLEVGSAPRVLAPTQSGRIVETRLTIGRRFRRGDILVMLDSGSERIRLEDAERKLRDYPTRLASLGREIALLGGTASADAAAATAAARSAEARAAEAATAAGFARDFARRQATDSASGAVSQVDAARAAADARRAEQTRDALAEEARRFAADARTHRGDNAARIEELKRTQMALVDEQAATRAQVAQLRVTVGERVIRAPVAGTVAQVEPLAPGSVVALGQRIATILPSGDLLVIAMFDPATALGRIQPGQRATLRLMGYPWAEFGVVQATVTRVAEEPSADGLRVELRVTRNAVRGIALAHGLSGTVEVSVENISPARLLWRTLGSALR